MQFTGTSREYAIILDPVPPLLTPNQSNILVDAADCARIADCGLAMAIRNPSLIWSALDEHWDSARWVALEILGDRGTHSRETYAFSFAMLMVEVHHG